MAERADQSQRRVVELPDGRSLIVRPPDAGDVDSLDALFRSLSTEDSYLRFFSAHHPSRAFLERTIGRAAHGGGALVAEAVGGSRELVAEADYVPLPDGDGEFSIVVAEPWRGWLGAFLLDALLELAAARGVPNLQGEILLANRRMFSVVRHRPHAYIDHNGFDSARVTIGTSGSMPTWPRGAVGPRLLVEQRGGRWRYEEEAKQAGFSVIVCPGPDPASGRTCPSLGGSGRACPLAADADAIVCALPVEGDETNALLDAHRRLHAGVPVDASLTPPFRIPHR